MTKLRLKKKADFFELPYEMLKSMTSPTERENNVGVWFANVKAEDVIRLNTDDNLRSYIAEHTPAKRNTTHKEIEKTILDMPDRFINRNSGITITCSKCEVDDPNKVLRLFDPSLINGAQTQGELKRAFNALQEGESLTFPVRAEIIMEPERDQIVEIAIARNTATSVKSVSQAGARGYLDDLKGAIESGLPGETLQMSETDTEGLSPQTVLQITRALMPVSLEDKIRPRNMPYKQAGKCLSDFSDWARLRDDTDESSEAARERYKFTIEMAANAMLEYRYWQRHEAWNGHRLHEYGKNSDKPRGGRPIRRKDNQVIWVAPGLLFPIISALSAFIKREDSKSWVEKPEIFSAEAMISRAVNQFRGLEREVSLMGRSEGVYDALSIYTDTIASVLRSAQK